MKLVFKSALHLFLRVILVCALAFMAFPAFGVFTGSDGSINIVASAILGSFYLVMLVYFFVFTMWTEGNSDANRVKIGEIEPMQYKGFLSSAIVVVPIIILNIASLSFGQSESIIISILNVLKLIFQMAAIFLTMVVANTSTLSEVTGTIDAQHMQYMVIIICAVYFAAFIGGGIGYIFGYRKISFFPQLKEKLFGDRGHIKKK